jgi:hypothetical protein
MIAQVRYASRLDASWYAYDVDAGQATRTRSRSVTMAAPVPGGSATAVTDEQQSGARSGKEAATTRIGASRLVLTTSNLLRHVVETRAPLVAKVKALRANLEALKGHEEETQAAYETLMGQVREAGWLYGQSHAFHALLAEQGLGGQAEAQEIIDEPAFTAGLEEGLERGQQDGEEYLRGYRDGKDQGWSDEPSQPLDDGYYYHSGYERGHQDGLAMGDYSPGRRYVFHNIALLRNIHEAGQNVFWHARGLAVVELTGQVQAQHNGPRWYQVRLVISTDPDFRDYLNSDFWMKRRWLNKGL